MLNFEELVSPRHEIVGVLAIKVRRLEVYCIGGTGSEYPILRGTRLHAYQTIEVIGSCPGLNMPLRRGSSAG